MVPDSSATSSRHSGLWRSLTPTGRCAPQGRNCGILRQTRWDGSMKRRTLKWHLLLVLSVLVSSPGSTMRQASWCDPAGGRPVRVRGSARLVANVAWPLATVAAKRTERLHTDLKIALSGLEEDQRREAGLRPHRLWRDGLYRPSHRRISGDVLSRRRCSVLGNRGTLDRSSRRWVPTSGHQTICLW